MITQQLLNIEEEETEIEIIRNLNQDIRPMICDIALADDLKK